MIKNAALMYLGFLAVTGIVSQCTAWTVKCTINKDGQMLLFKGENIFADNEKLVLAEWNPGQEECKFKLVVNLVGGYNHASFAVGPHKVPKKFFRIFDFDRYSGQVSQRGWHCKDDDCKGPITTFDFDVSDSNGTVYATVKEIDPGRIYVIESSLCQAADKPKYKFTYDFNAQGYDDVLTLDVDGDFYFDHENEFSGLCSSR